MFCVNIPKNTRLFASKINTFILDTFFPITCLYCQKKENTWLCFECAKKIKLLPFQFCPYCEKEITLSGYVCEKCKLKSFEKKAPLPLDALLCATDYQAISKLIHFFKYNFIYDLGSPLGEFLIGIILKNNLALPDLILPVPIHKRKLKWRGFNQAEILARKVAQNITPGMEIPIFTNLIYRKKYTTAQMKIKTHAERLINLKDAFALSQGAKKLIQNKKILLIDDVATTGATIFECAKILKSAGAEEVCGAVIARQKIK